MFPQVLYQSLLVRVALQDEVTLLRSRVTFSIKQVSVNTTLFLKINNVFSFTTINVVITSFTPEFHIEIIRKLTLDGLSSVFE